MKKLLTATAFILSIAGAAQAQNMFASMQMDAAKSTSTIVINPLTASSDGYVAIYDYQAGQVGKLLGVASVTAGANRETRVHLGRPVQYDVIAYLFVGDDFTDPSAAVDSVTIDVGN